MTDSATLFTRHPGNPLLSPERWPYSINAVMNAGATLVGDETVLLCRVEDRRGFSHLTCARSRDGASNWVVDEQPSLAYDGTHPEEEWVLEDPRVMYVAELERWIVTYTAFGREGPGVSLAQTEDFRTFERLGMVMSPEDKNAVLLPRRIDGDWVLLHRPTSVQGADVWLSRSSDLKRWRSPERVMGREGGWWDSARIGMGAPPLETDHGWLVVYHGVRQTVAGGLYRAGLALLDLEQPAKVLRRSDEWVLGPGADYEVSGDVPNVVFPCKLVHHNDSDKLYLYYGPRIHESDWPPRAV